MSKSIELQKKAAEIRIRLFQLIHGAKTGHTGGSLSNTDILTVLYYHTMRHDPKNPKWDDRDRFIASKGHSVESLWCILADLGYFDSSELETFSQFGTRLIGHPNNKVEGIEMNTGALGHGLSVSLGMALAAKRYNKDYRVFCLMGDGEQAEGSIWEAAMASAHYKLDNLVGIIDRNGLQISGSTESVMALDPLDKKWEAFGWNVLSIDGNDVDALMKAFDSIPTIKDKPTLIIANTVKGKGISFAENQVKWHHQVPTEEQVELAIKEIKAHIENLDSEEGQSHE